MTEEELIDEVVELIENGKRPEVIARAYHHILENMNENDSLNKDGLGDKIKDKL